MGSGRLGQGSLFIPYIARFRPSLPRLRQGHNPTFGASAAEGNTTEFEHDYTTALRPCLTRSCNFIRALIRASAHLMEASGSMLRAAGNRTAYKSHANDKQMPLDNPVASGPTYDVMHKLFVLPKTAC